MTDNAQKLLNAITAYIRPTTFPVAVKLVFDGEEAQRPAKAKKPMETLRHPLALCQGVALARRYGWNVVFDRQDHACPVSIVLMGYEPPEMLDSGKIACPGYAGSVEAGAVMEQANVKLPNGPKEMWFAPLDKAEFSPDVVLVYGNAAQIARMVQGANYKTGKGVSSKSFGRLACSSYIARTYLEGECSMIVPSGGERIFAICQDDELIFSIPASQFEDVAYGIEAVHKQGLIRYPTPFFGLLAEPKFPDYYWSIIESENKAAPAK
ncbi:MAG: DUF169 domain-containing protein [Sporomusaceae bacterium]|nr:DUF169 domain-containing protein [Sporomusaceae bacterium]